MGKQNPKIDLVYELVERKAGIKSYPFCALLMKRYGFDTVVKTLSTMQPFQGSGKPQAYLLGSCKQEFMRSGGFYTQEVWDVVERMAK